MTSHAKNAALLVAALAVVLSVGVCSGSARSEGLPLRVVARVALPGPANRFDYMTIDVPDSRLYIAHMNAGELLFFDLRRRRVVRSLRVPGVHGVIAAPQTHRVYASATDAHQLYTIDSRSGKVLARTSAGSYPDGLAYDSRDKLVFVSDESGGIESVFNAAGHRVGTVDLGGEAGNVQYDPGSGHILVAVQTRDDLAVIDPARRRIIRRVSLSGCAHPHGLHLDSSRRLAFVACDGNAALLTLDLNTMRVSGRSTVGSSPDVLDFDVSSRWLYVAAESGDVAVFAEHGRSLTKLGQSQLAPAAHTVAVDSRDHRSYFALESGSRGAPQLLIMAPNR